MGYNACKCFYNIGKIDKMMRERKLKREKIFIEYQKYN